MFNPTELAALDDKIKSSATNYNLEANTSRIERTESLFAELIESVTMQLQFRKNLTPEQTVAFREYLVMVKRVDYLYRAQLAAILRHDLPEWLKETITAEFPNELGSALAFHLTDLDSDGFVPADSLDQDDLLQPIYDMREQAKAAQS